MQATVPQRSKTFLAAGLLSVIVAACGGGTATSGASSAAPAASAVPATAAASAAASASPASANLDALIAAAKKEGKVTMYSGDTEDVLKFEAAQFQAKYGIQVDYVRALTDQVTARLSTEFDTGVNAADFYHASGEDVFKAKPQMWLPLSAANFPGWADYPAVARGANFVYLRDAPSVVNYNTNLVTAADSPKTWKDMLDPKWKGHILLTDPTSSPTYLAWAQDMVKTYGISYLEGLRAQQFKLAASGVPAAQQVAAGSAWISFPARAVHSYPLRQQKAPIAFNILGGANGAPIISGVLAKAPHPNAALLLMKFLTTAEFMTAFCKDNEAMSFWNIDGKSPNLQVPGCLKAPEGYQLANYTPTAAEKDAILKALGM